MISVYVFALELRDVHVRQDREIVPDPAPPGRRLQHPYSCKRKAHEINLKSASQ